MRIELQRHGSGLLACGLLLAACATASRGTSAPPSKGIEAQLCDGETVIALEAVPQTREEGQAAADAMMAAWKLKNPGGNWEEEVRTNHAIVGAHDNTDLLDAGQADGHPGRDFTQTDLLVWRRETERMVVAGARVFHSADELGSTIAVSCDMCHPDAANTHPETYPKYQVQIGRAVLLRDMINWCLEHPVRAEPMAEDDPRMRALEAYIYGQRAGTALAYGKH